MTLTSPLRSLCSPLPHPDERKILSVYLTLETVGRLAKAKRKIGADPLDTAVRKRSGRRTWALGVILVMLFSLYFHSYLFYYSPDASYLNNLYFIFVLGKFIFIGVYAEKSLEKMLMNIVRAYSQLE